MHIHLTRSFCCAADDYSGDAERVIEMDDASTLGDFVAKVLELGILQTSSSAPCLVAKSDRDLALLVPADKAVIELLPLSALLEACLSDHKVHFSFDLTRAQEHLYGQFRHKQLFGPDSSLR